ncbi:MAG: hypothetical protein ACLFV2_11470 [Desulfurivibrionaceae bacterium]
MNKPLLLALAAAFLLSGCQSYHADRDFGLASQAAWDSQIAHPGRVIDTVPTGREGITAEEVIDVHNRTFGEESKQSEVISLESIGQ